MGLLCNNKKWWYISIRSEGMLHFFNIPFSVIIHFTNALLHLNVKRTSFQFFEPGSETLTSLQDAGRSEAGNVPVFGELCRRQAGVSQHGERWAGNRDRIMNCSRCSAMSAKPDERG